MGLGFAVPVHVQGRASIADLFKPGKRCGIYVLHCSGSEYYAGKAIDVTRRYTQHRANHSDIEWISFREVQKDAHRVEEPRVIDALEAAGFLLRNIQYTSFPTVATDLDTIIPQEEQTRWLDDPAHNDLSGSRATSPDLSRKYLKKYQKLVGMPHSDEIIGVMRKYVRVGIPAPLRTELSFWCCSCLPPYGGGITLYSRINIYLPEVFTVGVENGIPFYSWHLAASPLSESRTRMWKKMLKRHRATYTEHQYKSGGPDQLHVKMTGSADSALAFLDEPSIVRAIRRFNLGLMRKGPSLNSLSHAMPLADRLLEP